MQDIPRYTEGVDPGFREFAAEDFAEPTPETEEQLLLRNKLKILILAEFSRLELEPEDWEYLIYSKLGVTKLDDCSSLFAISKFHKWLQKLESRRIENAV
jgi:hypothetical protein